MCPQRGPAEVVATTLPSAAAVAANATVNEAIKRYYRFIKAENDKHHVQGKLSILRAFFVTAAVTAATGVGASSDAPMRQSLFLENCAKRPVAIFVLLLRRPFFRSDCTL